ncbi:MAG: hypothetical protein GY751_10030 [Bacteroidetes bacterium]|nr:hypothetical protein [Bacteroidota bacterium]
MALQYKTKAGRLTNLTDARFFNAQGVEWLGFNMDVLDENCVALRDLHEMRQWLFEPKIVIECGMHQDKIELIHLANEVYAEAVQVPIEHEILNEDHFIYPVFVTLNFGDIQRSRIRKKLDNKHLIETVILKAEGGEFDWEKFKKQSKGTKRKIAQLKKHYNVLIDLPFKPEWFLEVIELLDPTGIQISGEKEDKPGISKVDTYADLLELIELEDD